MPGGPSIKVITTITTAAGVRLEPASELRLAAGLTAAVVTGDGPTRVELRADGTASTVPQTIVPQAAVLAAGPAVVYFVIAAARTVPIPIARIQIIPHATTIQDPTDFARVGIEEFDASGVSVMDLFDGPIFYTSINNFASMSTAITVDPDYTLPVGSTLVARWSKGGAGADVLGATWIIT